ncbi:MAG: hypothetical protein Q9199_002925 [Rusavskia elegans]
MATTTTNNVPQADELIIPSYREAYKQISHRLLMDAIRFSSYSPPEKTETDHDLKSTERVQNQAPSREEALIRVIMSLANRDLGLLASLPTILGCEHEASTHEASQFKVLHELIDRRTADFERMRAEGAVPKSEAEKKGTESGDDDEEE